MISIIILNIVIFGNIIMFFFNWYKKLEQLSSRFVEHVEVYSWYIKKTFYVYD